MCDIENISEHTGEHSNSKKVYLKHKVDISEILFLSKNKKCIEINTSGEGQEIKSHYYIGVDWLIEKHYAVYVKPKINNKTIKLDVLGMLATALKHPDVKEHTSDLYEIKFDNPYIPIHQQQDELTPLLVLHFLQLLKHIVRKGLKKSYYQVTKKLTARVKGKVLVGATIKHNLIKSQATAIICQYDRFGFNGIENKILKRTLGFIQRYLADYPEIYTKVAETLNYCLPAFHEVDEEVSVREIQQVTHNPFYKEYKEALTVAGYILRRFGYKINSAAEQQVKVPPHWIDMPKLFELYVLGLLKDRFGNDVHFQFQGNYGEPDFLLIQENQKIILDTKYKEIYQNDIYRLSKHARDRVIKDIRQLSKYARDEKILKKLGYESQSFPIVDCIIIYPDQNASGELPEELKDKRIKQFTKFYKIPIKLPVIQEDSS